MLRHGLRVSLLVLPLLALALGCNHTDVRPRPLAGRSLTLKSQVGAPELADVPPDLTFTGDSLSSSTGCSRISGKYRVAEGALVVDDLSTDTPIDCECAEAETWFETFLGGKPSLETLPAGEVVLRRDAVRLVFVEKGAPQ